MQEPQIVITPVGTIVEEQFTKNSINKKAQVVVKNIAFTLEMDANFDLGKANLGARLFYDWDDDKSQGGREVNLVRHEPFEYKVNLHEGGHRASFEIKIKVLTSQHEDMLFRIRFTANDPITHKTIEAYSTPIKVISKLTTNKSKPLIGSPKDTTSISALAKKRTSNDQIVSALQRLEAQQIEQTKFLQLLVSRLFGDVMTPQPMNLQALSHAISQNMATLTEAEADESGLHHPKHDSYAHAVQDQEDSFEVTFWKLVQSLGDLSPEAKISKMEEALKRAPPESAEKVHEFLESFGSAHPSKRYKSADVSVKGD